MALSGYLTVEGATQGVIEGSVTEARREGTIEVYGWSHEVISPRDAATGLPTGKRQHKPLTVTKELDKSTPLLAQALVTNENLTSVLLDIYKPNRDGTEELGYSIELVNAQIVGIQQEQLINQYADNADQPVREHVSFVYQRIVWTWHPDSTSAEDTVDSRA